MSTKIKNSIVADTFQSYPPGFKKKLIELRSLILKTAKEAIPDELLVETLKWGEPSYLWHKKNIGTTIRIHWQNSKPDQCGIYFHCQTNLIYKFKKKFGDKFNYEGNRAIIFKSKDKLPLKELKECIAMALMYHL